MCATETAVLFRFLSFNWQSKFGRTSLYCWWLKKPTLTHTTLKVPHKTSICIYIRRPERMLIIRRNPHTHTRLGFIWIVFSLSRMRKTCYTFSLYVYAHAWKLINFLLNGIYIVRAPVKKNYYCSAYLMENISEITDQSQMWMRAMDIFRQFYITKSHVYMLYTCIWWLNRI